MNQPAKPDSDADTMPADSLQPPTVTLGPLPAFLEGRGFQGIPGIEIVEPGRLWAVWYGGGNDEGTENCVIVTTSDDGGRSWAEPWLCVACLGRAFDPALWRDPLGRLWLFWAQTAPRMDRGVEWIWDGRGGVWAMRCDDPLRQPRQWTPPRRLCDGIMMNRPTVRRDGTWLLPVTIWAHPPQHPDAEGRRTPSIVTSRDAGETFHWLTGPELPERKFDEHHVIEMPGDELHLFARGRPAAWRVVSRDGGHTWGEPTRSNIPCPDSRFFIGRLRSGRLLLITHLPPADPDGRAWPGRSHLTAQLSEDDGATWQGGLLLDERHPVSYPDAVEDEAGVIHAIYDYNRKADRQILLARFREQDVLAGRPVSDAVALRNVVNDAGADRA